MALFRENIGHWGAIFNKSVRNLSLCGPGKIRIADSIPPARLSTPARFAWQHFGSILPVAARKGPFALSFDSTRDVLLEWRDLKLKFNGEMEHLGRSLWFRVGRKLGFL